MGEDDEVQLSLEKERFLFHPAKDEGRMRAHERVREICSDALVELWKVVPHSDERCRMVDALDDVCMQANAAIARRS